jgi:hypothetical protein
LKEDHPLHGLAGRPSKSRRRTESEICILLHSFNIKIFRGMQPGFDELLERGVPVSGWRDFDSSRARKAQIDEVSVGT